MSMARRISGERVSALPSGRVPERRELQGALVLLEPLDPDRHSHELFAVSHETDEARRVWTYLPDGPFDEFASFDDWVRRIVVERDRLYFAFRDKATGRLGGGCPEFRVSEPYFPERGMLWQSRRNWLTSC
jgi:hypothetical protein